MKGGASAPGLIEPRTPNLNLPRYIWPCHTFSLMTRKPDASDLLTGCSWIVIPHPSFIFHVIIFFPSKDQVANMVLGQSGYS